MLERGWRKRNPSTLLVRMQIGTAIIENCMEILQTTKNRVTMWFCNPTPGHISGKISNLKWYMHPNVALSTITKTWKQLIHPSIYESVKKMLYTHTHPQTHIHNGILLSQKNGMMPFAATWMDLEILIPSEISQKENEKYHMISLIYGI